MRSPGWNGGRRGTRRRPRICSRPTCSSIASAAAIAPGRASASTCSMSLRNCVRRKRRSIPTSRSPTTGTARSATARRRAEDLLELVRSRDLELIVAAVLRALVAAPALEDRSMAEARPLHVVVLDLADALDPQRFPREVLAGAPAALSPGHPRCLTVGRRPFPPRMLLHRILAQRLEQRGELLAHRHGECR